MLVLQGKKGEEFFVCDKDDNEIARIAVISVKGKNVRLGFDATGEIRFYRAKLLRKKQAERQKSSGN